MTRTATEASTRLSHSPQPTRLSPLASAHSPRLNIALAKAVILMSLAFLTLGLVCARPAHAQYPGGGSGSGYPGGGYPGSGYPGGGSGGGLPDPGHRWSEAYSFSGTNAFAIPSTSTPGGSTPLSYPWDATNSTEMVWGTGGGDLINANVTGEVTVTLTWVPAAGKTLQSDPPAKTVSIIEAGFASEDPGMWGGPGTAPVGVGSASNGLGDAQVPNGSGYTCSGSHRVKKDGSSGTITLGPFTLAAVCPVSTWNQIPLGVSEYSYEYYYWDWMGGLGEVGISIEVVPPAHPVNFRLGTRSDGTPNVDILDDGVLTFHYVWDSSSGNLSDLDDNHCMVCENVTHDSNSTGSILPDPFTGVMYYYPPDPFVQRLPEPTQLGVPGSDGKCADDQLYGTGDKNVDFSTPYKAASFVSTQYFFYRSDDLAPGDFPVLMGPLTITRNVYHSENDPNDWFYDVSESIYSSTLSLSF